MKPRKPAPSPRLIPLLSGGRWLPTWIELPIITVSEANQRGHWSKHSKRHAQQHALTMALTLRMLGESRAKPSCVKLTRIAPRLLDSDNAVGSLKYVRDGFAAWLGVNDGDTAIEWVYDQEQGAPRTYGVRVEVLP